MKWRSNSTADWPRLKTKENSRVTEADGAATDATEYKSDMTKSRHYSNIFAQFECEIKTTFDQKRLLIKILTNKIDF